MTGRVWTRSDVIAAVSLLVFTGVGLAQRQVGLPIGLAAIIAWSAVVVAVVHWALLGAQGSRLSQRVLVAVLVGGVVLLAVVNLLVPEAVDLRADRDDALDLAAAELVAGRDPWAVSTHIHPSHHPSPALGGVLLAAPFALVLGDSSWQNLAWVVLGVVLLVRVAGWGPAAAGVALVVSSPAFWNEWVFQSDLLVLGLKFVIVLLWGLRAMAGSGWLALVVSAVLFGTVLADRFLFLAFAVVVAAVALRRVPWRRSLPWLTIAGATSVGLFLLPLAWAPTYADQMVRNVAKGSEATGDGVSWAGPLLGVVVLAVAAVGGLVAKRDVDVVAVASVVCGVVVFWQVLLYSSAAGTLVFDGTLAVAYTPLMLVTGVTALVLPVGNSVTRVDYVPAEPETGVGEHAGHV